MCSVRCFSAIFAPMSAFFKIPSLFFGAVLLVSLLYNSSCNTEQQVTAREDALASKVVLGWTSMLIHLERASLG